MKVYLNQSGYMPESRKTAVIAVSREGAETEKPLAPQVHICAKDSGECVFCCDAVYFGFDKASEDEVWQADFSELTAEGRYYVKTGDAWSYSFEIGQNIYGDLNKLLCKALYFQRCGMPLEEKYAGVFAREGCHSEKAVLLDDYVQPCCEGGKGNGGRFCCICESRR